MNAPSAHSSRSARLSPLLSASLIWGLWGCGELSEGSTAGEAERAGAESSLERSEPLSELSFAGELSLRVTPRDPQLAPVTLYKLSALPSELHMTLPYAIRATGTVNVAPDPASEPSPVEAKILALAADERGLLPASTDEDPFSRELFLLSLSPSRASLDPDRLGELLWSRRSYRFELSPQAYPPAHVTQLPRERLSLNLPPLSALHRYRGRLVIDPYSQRPLAGAELVVTRDGRRLSELSQSGLDGSFELTWWGDLEPGASLDVTVSPRAGSRLPIARFSLDPSARPELLAPGTTEALAPVSLPQLGASEQILVGVDSLDQALWQVHLTQLWGAEALDGDPSSPERLDDRDPTVARQRAAGLWESRAIISASELGELWVYPREGVLTLQPPVDHPARTTRIELTAIEGDISSAPVLKQRLTGQVTGPGGEALSNVELYALQRSWPWRDTPHLPLGERWALSEAGGALELALDPGSYALRMRAPSAQGLAPRVIMTRALELGDVTLDAQALSLERGERFTLIALDESGAPVEASVELFCELPEPPQLPQAATTLSEAYQEASQTLARRAAAPAPRVLLSWGELNAEGRWSAQLSERSCPFE